MCHTVDWNHREPLAHQDASIFDCLLLVFTPRTASGFPSPLAALMVLDANGLLGPNFCEGDSGFRVATTRETWLARLAGLLNQPPPCPKDPSTFSESRPSWHPPQSHLLRKYLDPCGTHPSHTFSESTWTLLAPTPVPPSQKLLGPSSHPPQSHLLRKYLDPPGTHPKHLLRRYLEA